MKPSTRKRPRVDIWGRKRLVALKCKRRLFHHNSALERLVLTNGEGLIRPVLGLRISIGGLLDRGLEVVGPGPSWRTQSHSFRPSSCTIRDACSSSP